MRYFFIVFKLYFFKTFKLFQLFPDYGDVYNIAWSGENRWLLAGTAAGLVGWNINDDKVKKFGKNYR